MAQLRAELTGPSVLALVGELNGSALWRVLSPVRALQAQGYRCEWDRTDAAVVPIAGPAFDAVLLPRLSWTTAQRPAAEAWLSGLRASGQVCIYDTDDDLFSLADTYRRVELGWTDGRSFDQLEAERADRIWAMTQCDGVTVSTPHLADVVRSFTDRPVIVVPNAIDVPWFRGVLQATTRQIPGLTIGWAGGRRPDADLAPMAEAWGRIAARVPSVTFVVQGYVPPVITQRVPSERITILPWMPLEQYPAGLKEVDIACCAVEATRFNACKTAIKAMEAAVAGAAVVATPTVYGAKIVDGHTGHLAETADEWERALTDLVLSPSLRRIMARRLLRVVERRWSLTENLWRWPQAWAAIAEDARVRRGRLVTA